MRLDAIGYFLIGVTLFCACQLVLLFIDYHLISNWIRVDASVVDTENATLGRSASVGKMPLLQVDASKVRYRYWVEGISYHGFGLSAREKPVVVNPRQIIAVHPRSISILYNPEDPSKSVVDTGLPWGIDGVWGLGIIAALTTLHAWQVLRSRHESP